MQDGKLCESWSCVSQQWNLVPGGQLHAQMFVGFGSRCCRAPEVQFLLGHSLAS